MNRSSGIAASLALHAVFALLVLWPSRAPEIPTPEMPATAVPPPVQVIALSDDKQGVLLEAQDSAPQCLQGKAYMGIGMQFDLDDVVTVAPESYPAYKAGLRRGDEVLNPDFKPGEDGYDTVDFRHHGKYHRLHIKTQWICLR